MDGVEGVAGIGGITGHKYMMSFYIAMWSWGLPRAAVRPGLLSPMPRQTKPTRETDAERPGGRKAGMYYTSELSLL